MAVATTPVKSLHRAVCEMEVSCGNWLFKIPGDGLVYFLKCSHFCCLLRGRLFVLKKLHNAPIDKLLLHQKSFCFASQEILFRVVKQRVGDAVGGSQIFDGDINKVLPWF